MVGLGHVTTLTLSFLNYLLRYRIGTGFYQICLAISDTQPLIKLHRLKVYQA